MLDLESRAILGLVVHVAVCDSIILFRGHQAGSVASTLEDLQVAAKMFSTDTMRTRRLAKKGANFCVLVCGRSCSGKSTFINTLCEGDVYSKESDDEAEGTQLIRSTVVNLFECGGSTVRLTVLDTPGLGNEINNTAVAQALDNYLTNEFDRVLREECRVRRNPHFEDGRVHACLYFILPTGHGLREFDVDVMTTLAQRVNLIPVLAKADTLTPAELAMNKRKIMEDIQHFGIPIYSFATEADDEDGIEEASAIQAMLPFAIVASKQVYKIDKEYVRGRSYPWGFFRVDGTRYSDFMTLRSVLLGSHLQELKEYTHDVIYEQYRTQRLSENPNLWETLREAEA